MEKFQYEQRTGRLSLRGRLFAIGYAGYDDGDGVAEPGEGFNDPDAQAVRNVGPLPVGEYRICAPEKHPRVGAYAMRLDPLPGNVMHGRSGFFIHGEGKTPGASSHGCLILPRATREALWASGVRVLKVVSGAPAATATEVA